MQQALDSSTDIDSDSKLKMMNFFRYKFTSYFFQMNGHIFPSYVQIITLLLPRHTAFFLVAGDELKNPKQGIACKHAAGKPAAV